MIVATASVARDLGVNDATFGQLGENVALLKTAQPVARVNLLGHGVVNAGAALTYAKSHPRPWVAPEFATRWLQWPQFILLTAVVLNYSWVLLPMIRRRRAARPYSASFEVTAGIAE